MTTTKVSIHGMKYIHTFPRSISITFCSKKRAQEFYDRIQERIGFWICSYSKANVQGKKCTFSLLPSERVSQGFKGANIYNLWIHIHGAYDPSIEEINNPVDVLFISQNNRRRS